MTETRDTPLEVPGSSRYTRCAVARVARAGTEPEDGVGRSVTGDDMRQDIDPGTEKPMDQDVEECVGGAIPCGTLTTGHDRWNVYVRSVTRPGLEWFIELAVVGPRLCRVTVRARVGTSCAVTAQRVLAAVRGWLVSGDPRDHAFLELPGIVQHAT